MLSQKSVGLLLGRGRMNPAFSIGWEYGLAILFAEVGHSGVAWGNNTYSFQIYCGFVTLLVITT